MLATVTCVPYGTKVHEPIPHHEPTYGHHQPTYGHHETVTITKVHEPIPHHEPIYGHHEPHHEPTYGHHDCKCSKKLNVTLHY